MTKNVNPTHFSTLYLLKSEIFSNPLTYFSTMLLRKIFYLEYFSTKCKLENVIYA